MEVIKAQEPVVKGAQVVLFVRSWAKVSELTDLIHSTTGYHSPLIKVNIGRNRKHTEFAFCAVPKWAAEKLVALGKGKTTFEYARFEKKFEAEHRGLFIMTPRQNTQFSWMRKAIRSRVLDMLEQLELRKLIKPKTCYLSQNFRLFINDPDDHVIETVHAFIDGLPFYSGDRTYYIKSFYLRKRDPNQDQSTEESEAPKKKQSGGWTVKCTDDACYLEETGEVGEDVDREEFCVDGELM